MTTAPKACLLPNYMKSRQSTFGVNSVAAWGQKFGILTIGTTRLVCWWSAMIVFSWSPLWLPIRVQKETRRLALGHVHWVLFVNANLLILTAWYGGVA